MDNLLYMKNQTDNLCNSWLTCSNKVQLSCSNNKVQLTCSNLYSHTSKTNLYRLQIEQNETHLKHDKYH